MVPALLYDRLIPLFGTPKIVEDGFELVGRDGLSDHRFDLVGQARGFLDARARWRAHVQPNLSGVDAWKEVAAEKTDRANTTTDQNARNSEANTLRRASRLESANVWRGERALNSRSKAR